MTATHYEIKKRYRVLAKINNVSHNMNEKSDEDIEKQTEVMAEINLAYEMLINMEHEDTFIDEEKKYKPDTPEWRKPDYKRRKMLLIEQAVKNKTEIMENINMSEYIILNHFYRSQGYYTYGDLKDGPIYVNMNMKTHIVLYALYRDDKLITKAFADASLENIKHVYYYGFDDKTGHAIVRLG